MPLANSPPGSDPRDGWIDTIRRQIGAFGVRREGSISEGPVSPVKSTPLTDRRDSLASTSSQSRTPWYLGKVSHAEAVAKLQGAPAGTFFARESIECAGTYMVDVRTSKFDAPVVTGRIVQEDKYFKFDQDGAPLYPKFDDCVFALVSALRNPRRDSLASSVASSDYSYCNGGFAESAARPVVGVYHGVVAPEPQPGPPRRMTSDTLPRPPPQAAQAEASPFGHGPDRVFPAVEDYVGRRADSWVPAPGQPQPTYETIDETNAAAPGPTLYTTAEHTAFRSQ